MNLSIRKLFKLRKEEIRLFLWSAGLVFLIRASAIILNNYGETAFLKRFGVEYLPLVYVANSIITFIIMGLLTGLMKRLPSGRVLTFMLLICGGSVALMRLLVMTDIVYVYPVIFLMKAQYEALLSLVFWNLANDLFNTRQSKRIFPLITAGGVLGGMIGSFGTPSLARAITLDNLMLVYLCTTTIGAVVVWRMNQIFPTLPLSERRAKKSAKRKGLLDEIRDVIPLIKESTLIKILILLTFLPNVLIPIMNYQFNFAVNQAFTTEGGMLEFFGYFRGFLNVISLVILLFVGKLYSRWGLPVALMFHPINYVLAFLAFLVRFDVISAMYARISTNVIRTTINNPARDILMGLFPAEYRPLIRPFLRGTVVRLGILLGSGFIILFEGNFSPRYLSIVGMVFGLAWVASTLWLKRAYSEILLDLVSHNVLDLKSLENTDVGHLFQDKAAQQRLLEACRTSEGAVCVGYAQMLASRGRAADQILDLLLQKDDDTVIGLLPLVPPEAGEKALKVYELLLDPAKPELCRALAEAAGRLPGGMARPLLEKMLEQCEDLEVKVRAVVGLYRLEPQAHRPLIESWLSSPDPDQRRAGAVAAGLSGDSGFIGRLKPLFFEDNHPEVKQAALVALHRLGDPALPRLLRRLLRQDPESLPLEVLEDIPLDGPDITLAFIRMLGSDSRTLRELAHRRLQEAPELDSHLLIESLAIPNRRVREGIFSLMEELKISELEVVEFAKAQLQRAYQNLAEAQALESLPRSHARDLLRAHLLNKKQIRVEQVLRVLATQGESSSMRLLLRGLGSADQRLRSNAIEALESVVGRAISNAMVPLLEDLHPAECLEAGRRIFKLKEHFANSRELLAHLLEKRNWVTLYFTLLLIREHGQAREHAQRLARLVNNPNPFVRALAVYLSRPEGEASEKEAEKMEEALSLSDKILQLRGMDLFNDLKVSELAAVASVCDEEVVEAGETIITEGEVGETMYLIIEGLVSVHKNTDDGCEVELADMGPGDYFGEMALFDDQRRSATVIAKERTRLLVLHKREFAETVREYPQVALQMCKELSKRLRELHQKIRAMPVCSY